MSTDNDVARSLRSWLRESRHEDADRVLDAVFDQVPATPQRRAIWLARRFPIMNNTTVRWGLAAAAALLVVIGGIRLLPAVNIGGDPTPTPSPSSMAYNDVPDGDTLAPGRYFIDGMPVRVSLTLPTGWEHSGPGGPLGVGLGKPESSSRAEVLLAFWASVGWVYDDACDLSTLYEVGPSVDDLVDALVATSSVEATTPTEVSIGGFTGQHLTLRRAVECPVDYYGLWQSPDGSGGRIDHGQGDPPLDEIWILDVDGTRMVIGIHSYASAAAADLAEAREVVDSITFDRLD